MEEGGKNRSTPKATGSSWDVKKQSWRYWVQPERSEWIHSFHSTLNTFYDNIHITWTLPSHRTCICLLTTSLTVSFWARGQLSTPGCSVFSIGKDISTAYKRPGRTENNEMWVSELAKTLNPRQEEFSFRLVRTGELMLSEANRAGAKKKTKRDEYPKYRSPKNFCPRLFKDT